MCGAEKSKILHAQRAGPNRSFLTVFSPKNRLWPCGNKTLFGRSHAPTIVTLNQTADVSAQTFPYPTCAQTEILIEYCKVGEDVRQSAFSILSVEKRMGQAADFL